MVAVLSSMLAAGLALVSARLNEPDQIASLPLPDGLMVIVET